MLLSKSQERRIQEIIRKVHERRLADSLATVEEAIRRWREDEAPIFQIDDAVNQHALRSKRYFALYANTAATSPSAAGILQEALDLGLISPDEHRQLSTIQPRRR